MSVFAAVEAGGTTFLVAVSEPGNPTLVADSFSVPTTCPATTITACVDWLRTKHFDALAIASFGPCEIDPAADNFGFITTTPKPGWQNVDLLGPFRRAFDVPMAFDTDVNAPALSEATYGAIGSPSFGKRTIYITVGTGIGAGLFFPPPSLSFPAHYAGAVAPPSVCG
eukprot:gnl/Ergobibamus_cyprinoides/985.p1 GENE.gnl/Ergobibamus_cyprinoides/985~~gnl/Ergobibamus_cyprinoides/985.p1  ORF type:complete len:180 (-),score=45.30 gnl/Ergobibamus_cyprinoides/985:117-620(-)